MDNKYIKNVNKYLPYIILAIAIIVFDIKATLRYDDLWFLESSFDLHFFVFRYNVWSSRTVIEIFQMFLTRHFILWKICNIGVMFILVFMIKKIFAVKGYANWVLMVMLFLYPIKDMGSAGWIATMMNYMWPLSLGLVAIYSAIKVYNEKEIKWYEYIAYIFCAIYGSNQEQMMVVLAVTFMIISGMIMHRRKDIKKASYTILLTLISIANGVYMLVAPGNGARYKQELAWFPDYEMLTFFRRVSIGFSRVLSKLFLFDNVMFFILCVCIAVFVWKRSKIILAKAISLIPPLVCIAFFSPVRVHTKLLRDIVTIVQSARGIPELTTINSRKTYFAFMLFSMCLVILAISIFFAFERVTNGLVAFYILLISLAVSVVIGLSPTVWESGDRTLLFLYAAIVFVTIMLFTNDKGNMPDIKQRRESDV